MVKSEVQGVTEDCEEDGVSEMRKLFIDCKANW